MTNVIDITDMISILYNILDHLSLATIFNTTPKYIINRHVLTDRIQVRSYRVESLSNQPDNNSINTIFRPNYFDPDIRYRQGILIILPPSIIRFLKFNFSSVSFFLVLLLIDPTFLSLFLRNSNSSQVNLSHLIVDE